MPDAAPSRRRGFTMKGGAGAILRRLWLCSQRTPSSVRRSPLGTDQKTFGVSDLISADRVGHDAAKAEPMTTTLRLIGGNASPVLCVPTPGHVCPFGVTASFPS